MPRVKKQSTNTHLLNALQTIEIENVEKRGVDESIVDIMTFCNDPNYLNLPANNFNLWVSQKTILKCFYMGTRGNEDLQLTKEEWDWLYEQAKEETKDDFKYDKNANLVIEKLLNQKRNPEIKFQELILVLGRRSSKTITASIISCYEVYKLLVINNGDPHSYYKLPHDDEIAVINVALSREQAGRLFHQIQARLRNSPFFKSRIAGDTSNAIRLYTDMDLKKKQENTALSVAGSILILCGHSNPDSLAGYNAILLLFDEFAFYEEGGKITGKYFYNRLKPSLAHFYQFGDGRLVQISSPNARSGAFYERFMDSKKEDSVLAFQLPTWCVNPGITYDHPELKSHRTSNFDSFVIEFGAQWANSTGVGNYFEKEQINRCIRTDLVPHMRREYGYNYYLHVDPAKNSNNYAAVLVAAKRYRDNQGKIRTKCMLANVWVWKPQPNLGLLFQEIDKEIINICKRYNPLVVSYDDYHSVHSVQLLRSHGINTVQMAFNRNVKCKLYQNLRNMMSHLPEAEIGLYEDGADASYLISELKALKYKIITRGVSIIPDLHGEVPTDDLADCFAAAVSWATRALHQDLPKPVLVRTGII